MKNKILIGSLVLASLSTGAVFSRSSYDSDSHYHQKKQTKKKIGRTDGRRSSRRRGYWSVGGRR